MFRNLFENICFQIDAQRLYHHAFLGYVHRIASPGLLCFHAVDEFACLPYHAMRLNSIIIQRNGKLSRLNCEIAFNMKNHHNAQELYLITYQTRIQHNPL